MLGKNRKPILAASILVSLVVGAVILCMVPADEVEQFDACDDNKDGIVDAKEAEMCKHRQGVEKPSRTKPGDFLVTHVHSPENGKIAVRIQLPSTPRYKEGAPVVVIASGWFTKQYTAEKVGFHLAYDPCEVGAISVSHLWPGKTDPETGIKSNGEYDFGGPQSLASLRDAIRFAAGEIPNVDDYYLHELIDVNPLYDNVGLFASSHAGVVATNVLAHYGESLQSVKYFVGRENPTMAEMYPLELGHFDDRRNPVYNPYYNHEAYTPTTIDIDYSPVRWIQNERYPEGIPYFEVSTGKDYVLSGKGPHIMGKRYFSHSLTQALLDNHVFTLENWPNDLATPDETKKFWPYRITVHNYPLIGQKLPELKVMLVFAARDHVQAAPDKPHIRQAYDGFKKRAGLWTRLNADLSYVKAEIHESARIENGFPDNDANTDPEIWYKEAESWGFAEMLAGELTAGRVPLAGIAEMADRVKANNWEDNLDGALFEYQPLSYMLMTKEDSISSVFSRILCIGEEFFFFPLALALDEKVFTIVVALRK